MKTYKVTAIIEYTLLAVDEDNAKEQVASLIEQEVEQDNIADTFEFTVKEQ